MAGLTSPLVNCSMNVPASVLMGGGTMITIWMRKRQIFSDFLVARRELTPEYSSVCGGVK